MLRRARGAGTGFALLGLCNHEPTSRTGLTASPTMSSTAPVNPAETTPMTTVTTIDAPVANHVLRAPKFAVIDDDARLTKRAAVERPVVFVQGNRQRAYQVAKRVFDVIGAAALLLLFSPIMVTVFVILLFTTRGRPFFCQQRVGLQGRMFPMLKFRTMRLDADRVQHLVKNEQGGPIFKNRRDPRITRIGRFLRKTSIDEMPQLLNVLVGHMSLVGPRPPVAKEVAKYEVWQRRRLAVRPGLTCLWQISGRSEIEFEDWVRMDIWYVNNQSFRTDLALLAKTPRSVLSCRGAY
ncbi:MAG: sugar transferase [Planctomycetota bacterium]|nr:MAG: sugar transferase [Planctomycetota bacterium]REK47577.1 MAG: sugar transferase [Planctomycetota bacterium]